MIWQMLLQNDFFNTQLPLLRRKYSAFEVEDLPGLWRIHWQLGETTVLSTFYTRIDQACLLWGVISVIIFLTAQFTVIDWGMQAVIWSVLTSIGTISTARLVRYCRSVAPIAQLIDVWTWLMMIGIVLTNAGIFLGWAQILTQLCALWLGLSAIGYFWSGWNLRSRAFGLVGLLHLLGIGILPWVGAWQYLMTGILMGLSAILLAEFQWDSGDVCAHLANQRS
jgi:hypothetical protein